VSFHHGCVCTECLISFGTGRGSVSSGGGLLIESEFVYSIGCFGFDCGSDEVDDSHVIFPSFVCLRPDGLEGA